MVVSWLVSVLGDCDDEKKQVHQLGGEVDIYDFSRTTVVASHRVNALLA